MLKTYVFLSKNYALWASFFQFIISPIPFYWIAPQQTFTQSQKKSRAKILKILKVRDELRKNFRDFPIFFEIFDIFDIFEKFRFFRKFSIGSPIDNFRKNRKFSKMSKISKISKISKNLGKFSESISIFFHFQKFSLIFFIDRCKNLLRSECIK